MATTVSSKPKVPIYDNVDELVALANRVGNATSSIAEPGSVEEMLGGTILVKAASVTAAHNSMLAKRQQAELKTIERNQSIDALKDDLRTLRDRAFSNVSPNFVAISDYGFDVIQTAPGGTTEEPTTDPGTDPVGPAV